MPIDQLMGLTSMVILASMTILVLFAHKYKYTIFVLVLLAFGLRLILAQDVFLHEWDERFHALVAKNMDKNLFKPTLYANPVLPYDYQNWTANHIWVHKQPLSLWLIHLSLRVFGNHAYAVRIPSAILSALCIWMTFWICSLLFEDRKTSLLAAFLQGINGFVLAVAAGRLPTDHVDTHFLFFTELSILLICLYWKHPKLWLLPLIGGVIGLAILTKWLIALFVFPLFWLLLKPKTRWPNLIIQSIVISLFAALFALPWQVHIFSQFPLEAQWESNFNFRHLYQALEGHEGPWYYHLDKARMIWNELIYLPFIWLCVVALRRKDLKHLFVLLWLGLPYFVFSAVHTKMTAYVLIAAPAVFMMAAHFIQSVQPYRFWGKLLFFAFIALALRYSIEKIKPFQQDGIAQEKLMLVNQLAALSPQPKTVVFNFPCPIEAMFYFDCIAYSSLPAVDQLIQLQSQGYEVVLYNDGKLSSVYLGLSSIRIID